MLRVVNKGGLVGLIHRRPPCFHSFRRGKQEEQLSLWFPLLFLLTLPLYQAFFMIVYVPPSYPTTFYHSLLLFLSFSFFYYFSSKLSIFSLSLSFSLVIFLFLNSLSFMYNNVVYIVSPPRPSNYLVLPMPIHHDRYFRARNG